MLTDALRCDGKAFKGMCACVQYVLSLIPEKVFKFDSLEVHAVREAISIVCRPPSYGANTSQSEVPT